MEETGRPCLKGSADLLEDRRHRALALWDTGLSLNEVGASHWMCRQFPAAVGAGTAATGTRGFAGPLFARTLAQVADAGNVDLDRLRTISLESILGIGESVRRPLLPECRRL